MTVNQFFIVWFVAFVALIVLVRWTLRRLGVQSFSWSFGLAYIALIAVVSLLYYSIRGMGQAGLIWTIPMVFAIPSSLLIPSGSDISFTIFLTASGFLQYFLIGWIVDKIIQRKRRSFEEAPRSRGSGDTHEKGSGRPKDPPLTIDIGGSGGTRGGEPRGGGTGVTP